MPTVEVSFAALPAHVRTARLIAVAVARRANVADDVLDELRLAVGEACSRAVDVHRQHNPTAMVNVRFTDSDDVFTVSVLDAGPPGEQVAGFRSGDTEDRPNVVELLDSVKAAEPEIEPSTQLPAGLGLALIEGLVDDVSIRPGPDGTGTVVTMSWPVLGDLIPPQHLQAPSHNGWE
jgi:anti-sigma regulatory factor (Ser/Thr protein kinase)